MSSQRACGMLIAIIVLIIAVLATAAVAVVGLVKGESNANGLINKDLPNYNLPPLNWDKCFNLGNINKIKGSGMSVDYRRGCHTNVAIKCVVCELVVHYVLHLFTIHGTE